MNNELEFVVQQYFKINGRHPMQDKQTNQLFVKTVKKLVKKLSEEQSFGNYRPSASLVSL